MDIYQASKELLNGQKLVRDEWTANANSWVYLSDKYVVANNMGFAIVTELRYKSNGNTAVSLWYPSIFQLTANDWSIYTS